MKSTQMTPVKLRFILTAVMVLLVAAGVGVFMFGYKKINTFAKEAQDTASKAQASNNSLQELMTMKDNLAKNADAVNRAAQLVAESKSYQYQDQIINDINKYAAEAGIGITNITFADAKTTTVPTAAPAPNGTTGGTAGASAPAAAPTGVKSMTATVTIKNPVNYDNMLTFVHLIEQSLFRMQISQIGLSSSGGTNSSGGTSGSSSNAANQVTSDMLTIEVYVR